MGQVITLCYLLSYMIFLLDFGKTQSWILFWDFLRHKSLDVMAGMWWIDLGIVMIVLFFHEIVRLHGPPNIS